MFTVSMIPFPTAVRNISLLMAVTQEFVLSDLVQYLQNHY